MSHQLLPWYVVSGARLEWSGHWGGGRNEWCGFQNGHTIKMEPQAPLLLPNTSPVPNLFVTPAGRPAGKTKEVGKVTSVFRVL